MKYLPNIISIARIVVVAPTLYLLWHHDYNKALLLFLIAGVSDAVDGFLARRFNWRTRLGSYLDPIGDKLLLVGCYLVLGIEERLPAWLVVLVLGRDSIIVVGAALYRYAVKDATMQPLWISKVNTVLQIILILELLFSLSALPGAGGFPPLMLQFSISITALSTLLSGFAYIQCWSRRILLSLKTRSSA